MFKFVLLILTVSGLHAVPIAAPRGLQKTSSSLQLPDGFQQDDRLADIRQPIPDRFRQGTELSRRFLLDLNAHLVQDNINEVDIRPSLGNGFGEMQRRHWLTDEIPVDVPAQKSGGGGWVRVEEPSAPHLPDGFRQGTEPVMSIPDGFRQGTEPVMSIPDGFRQGTEPVMSIPDGFRQGTEPVMSIPDGFRQGTEPVMSIPDGYRQGTEPVMSIPDGYRQGTEPVMWIPHGFRQGTEPIRKGIEPVMSASDSLRLAEPLRAIPAGFRQGTEPVHKVPEGFRQGTEPLRPIPDGFRQGTEPSRPSIPDGFRQGTEPSAPRIQTKVVACRGEVINRRCYEFNSTPMTFEDAQIVCHSRALNAELASVTSGDLQSRLVSLVTNGGENNPVLTWLGGMVKASSPTLCNL